MKNCISRYYSIIFISVEFVINTNQDGKDYSGKCFISQADCYDDARALADLIEEALPKLNGGVQITEIGATIGCHTGPGTVALFFFGDNRAG